MPDYLLDPAFQSMLILIDALGLNFREGSVIEVAIKSHPNLYRYGKALEHLEILIESPIDLITAVNVQASSDALRDYDASTFNQVYSITKIVHLMAHARQRSTIAGALSNYRAVAAMILHAANSLTLEIHGQPELEEGVAPPSDDDDEMTIIED